MHWPIRRLLMHNPVVLELDGATGKRSVVGAGCLPTHLEHFVLDVSEADKMLAW